MQEVKKKIPYKVQKGNRPKIEEVINYCLDGDLRTAALGFAAWLRTTDFKIQLHASTTRGHNVKYNGVYLCKMLFFGEHDWEHVDSHYPGDPQYWSISPNLVSSDKYAAEIRNEGLAKLSWKPNYCIHKVQPDKTLINNTCNACSVKGIDRLVFGEDFVQCCVGFPAVKNPDDAELERIKRLLVLEKDARDNTP